jgi:hypothetical protein
MKIHNLVMRYGSMLLRTASQRRPLDADRGPAVYETGDTVVAPSRRVPRLDPASRVRWGSAMPALVALVATFLATRGDG